MNTEGMQGFFAIAATSLAVVAAGALSAAILDEVAKECETLDVVSVTPCEGNDNFLDGAPIPEESILTKDTPGVVFGEKPDEHGTFVGKPLSEDGHICVIGPTGSGKSAGILNPTMEIAAGFTVYYDIKRTLAERWTRLHGNSGKECLIFDPCGGDGCRYDPYALLRSDPSHLTDHARQIARVLLPEQSNDHNLIWMKTAEVFVTGAIIYCYRLGLTFIETMDWINCNSVTDVVDKIMSDCDESAKMYISKFKAMDPKIISGIGMELGSYLVPFSTSQAIRKALSPAEGKVTLDWSALNGKDPFDTILVFPEAELEVLQPLFCLMTNQLVESLTRRAERTYDENELPPVLLMCEEFARLGKVEAMATGLTTLRSRGVTIALFLQSFASLEKIYGKDTARVIRENCSYQVILGCMDVESQRYVSDMIGTTAVIREGTSEGTSISFGLNLSPRPSLSLNSNLNSSRSYTDGRVPLVQPHALRKLERPIVCTPRCSFSVKKRLVFNGERAFGENRKGWMPSQNRHTASLTHEADPRQSKEVLPAGKNTTTQPFEVLDTIDFNAAEQKLNQNSDARCKAGERKEVLPADKNTTTQPFEVPDTIDFKAAEQKLNRNADARRKAVERAEKRENARKAVLVGLCVMDQFPELQKPDLFEDSPELKQLVDDLKKVKNRPNDTQPPSLASGQLTGIA